MGNVVLIINNIAHHTTDIRQILLLAVLFTVIILRYFPIIRSRRPSDQRLVLNVITLL